MKCRRNKGSDMGQAAMQAALPLGSYDPADVILKMYVADKDAAWNL